MRLNAGTAVSIDSLSTQLSVVRAIDLAAQLLLAFFCDALGARASLGTVSLLSISFRGSSIDFLTTYASLSFHTTTENRPRSQLRHTELEVGSLAIPKPH
jgi:hypothetical protein